MTRRLFELSGVRRRNGTLATGIAYVLYSDEAGTVTADISATSGASATSTATVVSATSTVTIADIAGLGPSAARFYGPTDDTDALYLRCPADPSLGVQKIEADKDERLDALETGGGGVHPDLAAHNTLGLATQAELDVQDGRIDIVVDEGPLWLDDPRVGAVLDGVTDDGAAYDVAKAMVKVAGGLGEVGGAIGIPARRSLLTNRQLVLPNGARLVGAGRKASFVKAGGSFPTSTALVRLGEGTGIVFGCRVEELVLDCSNIVGSVGVYSNEIQEQSGLLNAVVINYRAWGVDWAAGASIVTVEHSEIFPSSSGSSGGVRSAASGQNSCRDVSVVSASGSHADAFLCSGGDLSLYGCHVEGHTDGAEYATSTTGIVDSLYGHASVTNLLHLTSGCNAVEVRNLVANSATNLLVDDFTGLTVPGSDGVLRSYVQAQAYFGKTLVRSGAGSPEGVMPAPPGSLWPRTDGGAVEQLYLKKTGTGDTGWAPVGQALYSSGPIRRSSGDATLNSVTWADVDNGLDIVLTAAAGDKIEVSASAFWNNEAVNGLLDVATIVSAAPVTYISSGTGTPAAPGITGWFGFASTFPTFGPSVQLTLGAGDISGGQVRLRLRYKTASATNKILKADTNFPFMWSAKNLGPG